MNPGKEQPPVWDALRSEINAPPRGRDPFIGHHCTRLYYWLRNFERVVASESRAARRWSAGNLCKQQHI